MHNTVRAVSLERGVLMKYEQKAFKREVRKQQVIGQFNIWFHNGDTEPKTMHRIARALKMTPSTKFRDILDEMVMEGSLTVERREKSGRWTANNYLVIKSLITEKYGKRRFVVKHRGVSVDSVEMDFQQKGLWS
jgi:hypothetical protein